MAGFLDRMRKPVATGTVELPFETASKAPPVELDPPARTPVFASDFGQTQDIMPDALGVAPALRRLAELITHAQTQTPLSVGIFGPPGSGKSFALSHLLNDIRAFADAAAKAGRSPFLTRVVTARVDAAATADPAIAIAAAVHKALHTPGAAGTSFSQWAEDAAYSSGDPQKTVREAADRVTDLRRRLDSEKQALQDVQTRRARLTENVLYDAAGTRIDSYARNNRTSIEGRLESFGFTGADPVATFKDLVRDYHEKSGLISRLSVFLHSLWAFRGQIRLIVLAILFAAFAWLMQQFAIQAPWLMDILARIQNQVSGFVPALEWIKNSKSTFTLIQNAALVAAAGALLFNVFRAFRFLNPIRRGVNLLNSDIDARRRDLDGLIGDQSQRTDELAKEAENQSAQLAQAERRADAARTAPDAITRSPFNAPEEGAAGYAHAFIQAVVARMKSNGADRGPQRIVVAIDNLEHLLDAQAVSFVQRSRSLLSDNGIASIIAADPTRLQAGLAATGFTGPDAMARLVQVPFRLDTTPAATMGELVKTMLGQGDDRTQDAPDVSLSSLDEPMRPGEPELLAALSGIAGNTPRQIKRFVNIYRLLRPDAPAFAPLALTLAVQSGGTDAEKREFEKLLEDAAEDSGLTPPSGDTRLGFAIRAAKAAQTLALSKSAVREAQAKAAAFSGQF